MTRIIQTGAAVNRQGAKLTTFIPVRIKRHGGRKVVIPAAALTQLPHAIDLCARREAPILAAARQPDFSVEALRAAMAEADDIH